MASLGELFVRVGADIGDFQSKMGEVTRTTNGLSRDFGNISSKLGDFGTTLTAGVTAPLLGVGAGALTMYADFQTAMNGVVSVSGLSGTALESIKTKASEMGSTTLYSSTQAALGMKELLASGLSAAQAIAAIGPAANLATAGGLELNAASEALVNTTNQFGLSFDTASRTVDVLVLAANSGTTSVRDLTEAMKYSGGFAATAGFSYEQTAAALSLMSNNGLKGSIAGTSLAAALREMLAPSAKQLELANSLGIAFTDQAGKMLPLDNIIQQVAASNMTAGQASILFGAEGLRAILSLSNSGVPALQGLTTELTTNEGAAKKAADVMGNGVTAQLTKMKNALAAAALPLAEALMPAFNRLVSIAGSVISALTSAATWFNSLPEPVKNVALGIGALVIAIGPVLMGLSGLAGAFSSLMALPGMFSTALGIVKTAFVAVGGSITGVAIPAMSAILPIVAAVVAAFALWKLAEWAYNNFEPFKKLVDEVFTFAKTLVEGFIQLAILQFNLFKAALVHTWDALKMVGDWFLDLPAVQTIITTFKDVAANAFNWIADKVKFMNDAMGAFLEVIKKVNGSTDDLKTKSNAAAEAQQKQAEEAAKQKKESDELAVAIKKQKEGLDALLAGQKDNTSQYKEQKKESEKTKKEVKELSDEYKIMVAQLNGVTPKKKDLIESIAKLKNSIESVKNPQDTMLEDLKALTAQTTAMNDGTSALATIAPPAWFAAGNAASESVKKIEDAYKSLGITSTATLEANATKAQTDYLTIKNSGIASANDILAAEKAAMDARVTYLKSIGESLTTEEKNRYAALETALPTHLNTQKTSWEGYKNSVSTTITNMAQNIGKTLFDGDLSWGEKSKKMLSAIGSGFTSLLVEPATEAINGFITGALKSLLSGDGLGGVMTSLTNIGSKITGIFGSAGGAASGAAGAAGSSAGSAGGATGAVGSGVMGTIGAIGSIGSMVSGIIGNFQMAGMNKTLDLIEWNTRKASLHLKDIFTPIYDLTNDFRNRWMGGLGIFNQEGDSGIRLAPYEFNGGSFPIDITTGLEDVVGLLSDIKSSPRTIEFNISGVADPKEVADIVLNRLAEELG